MSNKEVRAEIKKLVISKGLDNITGYDLNELHAKGAGYCQMQNALSYFRFSPQTAKYRGGK